VKLWTTHTPPDSDALKNTVDAFNTANPDTCVKMTIVPGSETDIAKLLTSIRGGVAPDVYMADRFTVPQRAAEGVLDDITDATQGLSSQYLDFAWAETQYQGKTYALPFDTDARALWYNKDLIQKAGEDPAQLDISKGPPTIDTVVKIADKVTKKDSGGNYDVMGWVPGGPGPGGQPGAFDQGWHYTWGFANGGKFADLGQCKVTPTDPGVVAGFQFLYDWSKAHDPKAVSRWVSSNLPTPQTPASQNPIWTGKLAMTISGDWRIAEQKKYAPTGNFGFTYIPVAKAGDQSATWAGGWSRPRSGSSGSCPGCSTARSASAARRAPARRSCAATARCGAPTRTGSSSTCSPRRSSRSPARARACRARPSARASPGRRCARRPGRRTSRRGRRSARWVSGR